MATLRVAEFPGLCRTDQSDSVPILSMPPSVEQSVVVSASGVIITNPFRADTKFVELCTDTTCSIAFGIFSALTTATVTTGNGRMNANERVIRAVPNVPPVHGEKNLIPPTLYGLVVIAAT